MPSEDRQHRAWPRLGMIGTGFVADHYMRSLATVPELRLLGTYDISAERLRLFSEHWNVPPAVSIDDLIDRIGPGGIMLNLTNPSAHYEVSRKCLEAGLHVYSEKPLALSMDDAMALHALASERGLMIASAPCTFLGESAQTVGAAIRSGVFGKPRLVYAELDDGFIAKAPYRQWIGTTGSPWPARDEFTVGCTQEHAGYYLTWLIAFFGSVRTVVAASACLAPDEMGVDRPAPDFSAATLFFESGIVARLTCSIIASHDHSLRITGDHGVLEVKDCWDNSAAVRFRRRFAFRRRLINAPLAKRLRLRQAAHAKAKRWGSVSLNYALGPKEMADAIVQERPCRVSADLALHLTEVTLAIHASGEHAGAQTMRTRCASIPPMPWATRLRGH